MSTYRVGVGKVEVTNHDKGLQLQGFADKTQKSEGDPSPLYSRAFLVADDSSQNPKLVAIVVVDIWGVSTKVKDAVITQLSELKGPKGLNAFTIGNVLISGTHTHSAPGGYSGGLL